MENSDGIIGTERNTNLSDFMIDVRQSSVLQDSERTRTCVHVRVHSSVFVGVRVEIATILDNV